MGSKVTKCGPSHHYRGTCDLIILENIPTRNYFGDSRGPQFTHADWCPIVRSGVTDCDNEGATKIDSIEVFHPESRCLNVNLQGGIRSAVCIRAYCNEEIKKFAYNIGGREYFCGVDDDGKEKQITHNDKKYGFLCPRLAQVCPE